MNTISFKQVNAVIQHLKQVKTELGDSGMKIACDTLRIIFGEENVSEILSIMGRREEYEATNRRLLLHPVGEFYEVYGDDAFMVGFMCDLEVHDIEGMPRVGFPKNKSYEYLSKMNGLVKQFAICEECK